MPDLPNNPFVTMPILPVRGMVLFPNMVLHFDVGRESSILALNQVMTDNRTIFLAAQKDIKLETPNEEDLYLVGAVAEVKQIIKAKEHFRVLVEGKRRGKIQKITQVEPYFQGEILDFPTIPSENPKSTMNKALLRTLKDLFEEYSYRTPRMTRDLIFNTLTSEDPEYLAEYITTNLPIHFSVKQELLEESDIPTRVQILIQILEEEIEILALEQEISDKVRSQIDTNQREFYLREQMKAISSELGENDEFEDETTQYLEQILALELEEDLEEQLLREVNRLKKLPSNAQEAAVLRNWLDTVLELPWNTYTKDRIDVKAAARQLDRDHYGMKKVKERILELIAVRQLAPEQKGQIICLVGPPGTGKTSIARSVAKSLHRNYVRMSLGGVRDESDIRGHRKTYVGAMAGRIIMAMQQAKSSNPLLLLDEVDKLGSDFRGDPSAALLEVLDSEQNFAFRDHYVELPFDLSQVLFLATANDLSTIPRPLLDRMEIIELGSYTREEKYQIARRHLVPKQLERHGLVGKGVRLTQTGLYTLIDFYTREAGVRTLERQIASIFRKVAKEIVSGDITKVSINAAKVQEYLGVYKFKEENIEGLNEIGLVNGLAWTSVGGAMLQVEVAILNGTGKIVLTGSLGDVMKESAQAAISYVRSCTPVYNIEPDFYKTKDIHIHVPEGAVPKDGPSAGVTIATGLVSALSGIPVKGTVAMTGEISLRGRVMAIGGLREKAMAAYRHGIKTIIIPESNLPDLEDLDQIVLDNVSFIPATKLEQVFDVALVTPEKLLQKANKSLRKKTLKETKQNQKTLTQNAE